MLAFVHAFTVATEIHRLTVHIGDLGTEGRGSLAPTKKEFEFGWPGSHGANSGSSSIGSCKQGRPQKHALGTMDFQEQEGAIESC